MSQDRSLRILILNDLLPPDSEGGLELSALELGQALQSRGHEVHWICSEWRRSYCGPKEDRPAIHRILRFADVRANPHSRIPRKLESIRAVERKINIAGANYAILADFLKREDRFDVALVFGVLAVGLGTVQALTDGGLPVVWSVGDVSLAAHFAMPTQTKLYNAVFKTVGRKWHRVERTVDFSHMLFTSGFVRDELAKAGIMPETWSILPRAVDFEPRYCLTEKVAPPSILIASRLTEARGIHVAIEAAAALASRRPDLNWTLDIAGGGDPEYMDRIRGLAKPICDRVRFLGKVPKSEIVSLMRKATLVLNPTVEVEGFGRTNIEALACGVALIASDVPAIHEVVDETCCALLFPPGDMQTLSKQMEGLLTHPDELKALGEKGVECVCSRYTLASVVRSLEAELLRFARQG